MPAPDHRRRAVQSLTLYHDGVVRIASELLHWRLKISHPKESRKKFKKSLKKVLTKGNGCGIIVKLSERRTAKWSLKIEQQEISTKHCKVRNTRSRQRELYILNKVKEAKKK